MRLLTMGRYISVYLLPCSHFQQQAGVTNPITENLKRGRSRLRCINSSEKFLRVLQLAIKDVRYWKRKWNSAELVGQQKGGSYRKLQMVRKKKTHCATECEESSWAKPHSTNTVITTKHVHTCEQTHPHTHKHADLIVSSPTQTFLYGIKNI